ncbi:MAG: hypothetical protein MR991_08320 [Clostridiales bacterium]|nr:hypothetical protein [Clostridiales bacterium]MDD7034960.1 hypothetical protein [Bacillota bacterium]MDY2920279.1 hypothetical protein [Lentihominibacter sp.]
MDIKQVVNIICLIAGICILIFASLIGLRVLSGIPSSKAIVLFILGGIVVIWSLVSMLRK